MTHRVRFIAATILVLAIAPALAGVAQGGKGKPRKPDTARYILPPGNFGGLPTTPNSTDQLPLYSGLTPLRDDVTKADINNLFLPEDFKPIGETPRRSTRVSRGCACSTTRTGSRTSTATPVATSPSAPAGQRRATAGS